jgi:hypothetical protein
VVIGEAAFLVETPSLFHWIIEVVGGFTILEVPPGHAQRLASYLLTVMAVMIMMMLMLHVKNYRDNNSRCKSKQQTDEKCTEEVKILCM